MTTKAISDGVVHDVLVDLRKALVSDPTVRAAWEDITQLARNEWICCYFRQEAGNQKAAH